MSHIQSVSRIVCFFAVCFTANSVVAQSDRKQDLAQAIVCINRSKLAANEKDWLVAIRQQQKAIDIRSRLLGESHLDTIECIQNLAWIQFESGDYQAAAALLGKSLQTLKKSKSKAAARTRITLSHRYAWMLHWMGQYELLSLIHISEPTRPY